MRLTKCDKCGTMAPVGMGNGAYPALEWAYRRDRDLCPGCFKLFQELEDALDAEREKRLESWLGPSPAKEG